MTLRAKFIYKGGAGSGNFGHYGRPGKVGGSGGKSGAGGGIGGSGAGGGAISSVYSDVRDSDEVHIIVQNGDAERKVTQNLTGVDYVLHESQPNRVIIPRGASHGTTEARVQALQKLDEAGISFDYALW